jgi:RTX calcium-binding nonapeptide repeat (4 copies)
MQASCLSLLMIGITRVILLSLLFPILIPPNPVWTDTNDDDSQTVDPQYQYPLVHPFQDQLESHQNSLEKQSDLPTCLSQGQNVRNIQGHIEIEKTFSDVCESTDNNEIPLGVQDDDIGQEQPNDLRECTVQGKNIQGHAIIGTIFADVCEGTDHSETILGLQDNDVLTGNGGDDIVFGNEGNERIFGNGGNDILQGNLGDDKIDGGGHNDFLIGGDNDDILSGEDGNDKLFGWFGNDILKGGPSADQFICGEGIDTVLDYNPAKGDVTSNDCEIVNTGK